MYTGESFFVADPQYRYAVYEYAGDISTSRLDIAIQNRKELSQQIRYRADAEIPTGPGYCIEDGFIAGKEHRSESFNIGVEFPAHPGAVLELFATTQGEVEPPLLERMKGEAAFQLIGRFAGVRTLRRDKRDVGPIKAEEYLIAANEEGQQLYSFAWEAPGKADSIAEPNITAGLGVLGQSVVDDEHPYKPAFKSDEEALELWDAIIASIRLRPGAV